MEIGKLYKFSNSDHVHYIRKSENDEWKRAFGVTSVLKYWGDPSALVNWAANQAVDYIKNDDGVQDICGSGVHLQYWAELLEEARTAHTRTRDKAGEKGTDVHGQLEIAMNQWIDRGMYGDHEDSIVNKVMMWMFENGIKPLKSEMPVYSIDKFYAGIADGVIEKDGKKYILDFKTSSSIQTKAFIQCAAYSVAIKDMKPDAVIDGVVVVHIPKGASFNPEKNVYWFYDLESLERAWLSIYDAYKTDLTLQKLIKG